MLWSELLERLDGIRAEIRSTKSLKQEVPADDAILTKIGNTIYLPARTPKAERMAPLPNIPEPPSDDPLFSILPEEEEPSAPKVVEVVDRGSGQGRMLVMARETPRVQRPADIVEVTEEELAK